VRLAITDGGRAVLRRSPEPIQEKLISGIAALPPGQRRTLANALHGIARSLSDSAGHPPMFFENGRKRRQ
jgi:hypothetical protein